MKRKLFEIIFVGMFILLGTCTLTPDQKESDSTDTNTTVVNENNIYEIYFYNNLSFENVYIYFKYQNSSSDMWSSYPGVKMRALAANWMYVSISNSINYLEFVFNDGNQSWVNLNNMVGNNFITTNSRVWVYNYQNYNYIPSILPETNTSTNNVITNTNQTITNTNQTQTNTNSTTLTDNNNTIATAISISLSNPLTNSISPVGDYDYIKFYATSGKAYSLKTSLPTGGEALDTYLALYNSIGGLLDSDDNSGDGSYSWISEWSCAASGYYYVKINEVGNDATGDYELLIVETNMTQPITNSVDTNAPNLTIIYPISNAEVASNYTLSGYVTDDDQVKAVYVKIDGGIYIQASLSLSNWSAEINLNTYGIHTNSVYAVDNSDNHSMTNILFVERSSVPSINIDSPADGILTNQSEVILRGTAAIETPYQIDNVLIKTNGGNFQTVTGTTNWTINWNLSEGNNIFTIIAMGDNGKATTNNTYNLILDSSGPSLTITQPSDGEPVPDLYALIGTVSDNYGVENVYVRNNGGAFVQAIIYSGNLWSNQISISGVGSYLNEVYSVDSNGNSSVTNSIIVHRYDKVYVAATGTNANDGLSASSPKLTIQEALILATNVYVNQVYIASGTYTPGNGLLNNGTNGFLIENEFNEIAYHNFEIIGGWNNDFSARIGQTVLDGKQSLYHLGTFVGVTNILFDGFSLINGNANGSYPHNNGGGLYLINVTNNIFTNLIVSNNSAKWGGGAYVYYSHNNIFSVTFMSNNSYSGGGVYIYAGVNNSFSGSFIRNNGGGAYLNTSSHYNTFSGSFMTNSHSSAGGVFVGGDNNTFSGSFIRNNGGGAMIGSSAVSNNFSGSFINNSGYSGGGVSVAGAYNTFSGLFMNNSARNGVGARITGQTNIFSGDFTGNKATNNGGGVYLDYSASYNTFSGTYENNIANLAGLSYHGGAFYDLCNIYIPEDDLSGVIYGTGNSPENYYQP